MAKLVFRYGVMGSSKSANLQMVAYNYRERGMNPVILKPGKENRDGEMIIKSRIGLETTVYDTVEGFIYRMKRHAVNLDMIDIILVDEAQFLSKDQVDQLADMVDSGDTTVICYGLRTDFRGHFFPGSQRLMEIADNIEEIPTICWCGVKARFNARVKEGKVIREGKQIMLGGNESYIPLCRKHFILGQLGPDDF